MTRPPRRLAAWVLLPLLVASPGRAEEAPAPPWSIRLYPVQGLTSPVPGFRLERGPFAVVGADASDSAWPLFGSEAEEGALPWGSVNEVIEVLKATAGGPGAWEEAGAEIWSYGEGILGVRGPSALQDAVARRLAEFVRDAGRSVAVDVAVFAGDPPQDGDVPRAVAAGGLRPLGFGRTVVRPQGASVARDGGLRAFVGDYDVEVAQHSRIQDPIVLVAPEGLAFQVDLAAASATRVQGRLRLWWASPAVLATLRTGAGEPVEQVVADGRVVVARLDATPGVWSLLPSQGGVHVAVRARVSSPDVAVASGVEVVEGAPWGPAGAPEPFEVDVGDLLLAVTHRAGEAAIAPYPSNYTPPSPPELREPAPALGPDALLDLVRRAVDPESWNAEGFALSVGQGRLVGATDATRRAAVERVVERVRALRRRSLRVSGAVVAMPVASLPEWWTGSEDALVQDGVTGLLARPGARLVDVSGLRLLDWQRGASVAGRDRSYVGDLDVEIAEKAVIADPIVHSIWEGTSLDVDLAGLPAESEVVADLRWVRGVVRGMRSAATPLGPITCPDVGIQRVAGSTALRLGAPRIVGASASGGDVTLVVLTLTRD